MFQKDFSIISFLFFKWFPVMKFQVLIFFSRLLVSMNTSIYQVNREKIYIAKSENKSSSPISCYTSFLSHLFQIDIFLNMLIQKKKKR